MTEQLKQIRKFGMVEQLDHIYANSKNGDNAKKLYRDIVSKQNLLMAIDTIRQSGAGDDNVGKSRQWFLTNDADTVVDYLRQRMRSYTPAKPRELSIRSAGEKRTVCQFSVEDCIIQQAIKQVLEPWCEARFHPHSYGYRPLRQAHHALSRAVSLINVGKMYYVVSIDISKLFDNIAHSKVKQALWSIGVHDKQLLSIVSKMLVTMGDGSKGLSQGSILAPLLSNVVLNRFDWWVSSQWETFPTKWVHSLHQKNTDLKSGYLVRYADDIKIMCRNYAHAMRWYHAATKWLHEELGLDIHPTKSGVTNTKRKSVDFLGFSIRTKRKGTARYGYVAETHIAKDRLSQIQQSLKQRIKTIQVSSYSPKSTMQYNLHVMGIKRYYQYATHVYPDLDGVAQSTFRTIKVRLRDRRTQVTFRTMTTQFKQNNKGLRAQTMISVVSGTPMHVIQAVHHKNPMNFSQASTIYTKTGRSKVSEESTLPVSWVRELVNKSEYTKQDVEFVTNRIAHYVNDGGKCYVTGMLLHPSVVHCHHKKPRRLGGGNEYRNLCIVHETVHKLIHGTDRESIQCWLAELRIAQDQLQKLNRLRRQVGNDELTI